MFLIKKLIFKKNSNLFFNSSYRYYLHPDFGQFTAVPGFHYQENYITD